MSGSSPGVAAGLPPRSEAVVDLDVIRHNVATLRAGTRAEVMACVKADGYGHGIVPAGRAALAGGASWLGVAFVEEALTLRRSGVDAPLLAWLASPGEPLAEAVGADVDLSAGAPWALAEVVAGAREVGRRARVHLEVDTGLGRGGAPLADWGDLVDAAAKAQAADEIEVVGVWSHLACSDQPDHPMNAIQVAAFSEALDTAARRGVVPTVRHLANSGGTLSLPDTHFDLVRPGIAVYGLPPGPATPMDGLTPAMTLRSRIALTKRVPAGSGVSYGHAYHTGAETTLALVPLGYADGIPRNASNIAEVWLGGRRHRIAGRVCMDQFVLDVGDQDVRAGDEALLFGPGRHGEPTAEDWAGAVGSIGYEIVTRIGARVPRRYVGGPAGGPA